MKVELDDGDKHDKTTDRKIKTQYKESSSWAKQTLEAATEIFWKKICSYKQLFWKLPGETFSQNPWKNIFEEVRFS